MSEHRRKYRDAVESHRHCNSCPSESHSYYFKKKRKRRDEDEEASSPDKSESTRGKHKTNEQSDDFAEDEFDYNFDWEGCKSALTQIFFNSHDVFPKDSPEYTEFWEFLRKFVKFHARRSNEKHTPEVAESKLGIPRHYDKRYRINVTIRKSMKEIQKMAAKTTKAKELTLTRLSQFKYILICYIDFLQKQKFNKLQALRKAQENLPIYKYKDSIVQMVTSHPVVIVAGDTGCGKSTQVPQYLLDAGFDKVACTQPRRIACISLSKRVAYETLNEFGSKVGYQIRFDKHKTQHTKILFLTEGLLLRQCETDPLLSAYDLIILDEVHERHLQMDFLLGVLRCLIQHRQDLKVVLMSATINIDLFSKYFCDAPVVKVPGRLYPIKLHYMPINQHEQRSKSERLDPSPYLRVMTMIEKKYAETERGDVLVFMSGMSEIEAVVDAARQHAQESGKWIVLPLHGALSVDEQDKVFDIAPEGVRKCVVSTNIAETSVTIDGIRFVIDSGKAKEMNYFSQSKMQRLQEFWVSKASAEQRKGRAGRTGPGVCYRLYDEKTYDSFTEYTTPEIHQVPLDSLILQMISMGLPDVREFPFIEAPSAESIEYAVQSLKEHGALDAEEKLAPLGETLAKLPLEVVLGKMLIMGCIFEMLEPVSTLAAALNIQSPFTSYAYRDPDCVSARKNLESTHGDPFTLLNCYNEWLSIKADRRESSRKWCKRRGLEEQRFYEISKLKKQFKQLLTDHGLLEKQQEFHTSTERRQHYGEMKRLRDMKREYHQKKPRQRKVLKPESTYEIAGYHGCSSDEEKGVDIHDVDFRLTYGQSKLDEEVSATELTHKDVTLLKIILTSGLYPQLAIADEHNSYKRDSEQVFHTKDKPFVILHPVGVFAADPEIIQLKEHEIEQNVGDQRGTVSGRHQLLTFVTLLETKNKPYMINTARVPALQILLLFSHAVDTSADLLQLVFDEWLKVTLTNSDQAHTIIGKAVRLRMAWNELLQKRLKGVAALETTPSITEYRLARLIHEYLYDDVTYSIRRLLAADKHDMYIGPGADTMLNNEKVNPFEPRQQCSEDPVKGGLRVNDYLVYGCLDSSGHSLSSLSNLWTCPHCEEQMLVTTLEKLQHENSCSHKASEKKPEQSATSEADQSMNPLKKSYFCENCDKIFSFTSVEILKHKKEHKP